MNLLVTLDRNYLTPLKIMLGSLFFNNQEEKFSIYMIGNGISPEEEKALSDFCADHGGELIPVSFHDSLFENAPVMRYYSQAMYYRLLAAQILPQSLDKVLYLDPDILIIGKLCPLYEMDITGGMFGAAMHNGLTGISGYVTKLRLPDYETDQYFNSGVLLMDLAKMREKVRSDDIFRFVEKYKDFLILPDQDILNGLYGDQIISIDESLWNYDVRQYETYRLVSQGEKDMDWVMNHTAVLHFCGKNKPWKKRYRGRFSSLYKHYQHLVEKGRI